MSDLHRQIDHLRHAASHGDHAAAKLLLSIGNQVAGHLRCLSIYPPGTPGREAIDSALATAESWPLVCPAIEELRESCLQNVPIGLGSAAPIRIQKGKTKRRNFSYDAQTGFALDVFGILNRERRNAAADYRESLKEFWHILTKDQQKDWRILAAGLPPLDTSPRVISLWKKAGVAWAEDACGGQWKMFPWPQEVKLRAEQWTSARKRGVETAIKELLGKGFASIALPPATH